MDNNTLSPSNGLRTATINFVQAIDEVIKGNKITRVSWNQASFGLLKDGWLTIFIDGQFKQWLVNDGDMLATDWIVLHD